MRVIGGPPRPDREGLRRFRPFEEGAGEDVERPARTKAATADAVWQDAVAWGPQGSTLPAGLGLLRAVARFSCLA